MGIEDGPGYLVKRVQQALRRQCDDTLRPTGISMAQYAVLRALADHPGASAAELARLCFVTRQSLQDVLTTLRSWGFVEPDDGPTVGRARSLQLTAAGGRQLRKANTLVLDVERAMTDGLSDNERVLLGRLLTRCAENLESGVADSV